jgi:hydrogenase maturation factor
MDTDNNAIRFELGKLPAEHLARLVDQVTIRDPRVILGPRVGEDAAVIDMGDRYLVAKSDPITFATDSIGWYAVQINANDVACTGAAPRWFLATVLLPGGRATPELVDDIFTQILDACEELDIALVGGHTEITYDLNRPIVLGAMLGEVAPESMVKTGGARPGDVLMLTQRVAVEGTAIIAREKRQELSEQHGLSEGYLDRCADFIRQPGISVVAAARVATATAPIHAMHDPTEGGLATGLWELATAAGVGLEVDARAVPVFPETERLCDLFGLDPWGLIASGSLLLSLEEQAAPNVEQALTAAGIEVTRIGRVTGEDQEVVVHHWASRGPSRNEDQATIVLPKFPRDEIARLFE